MAEAGILAASRVRIGGTATGIVRVFAKSIRTFDRLRAHPGLDTGVDRDSSQRPFQARALRLPSSVGWSGVKSRLFWYQGRSVPVQALPTAL